MSYSAAQIVTAFLDANRTIGWSARSYTTDTVEQVYFSSPSKLVKITYDCKENIFIIGFEKAQASWGDYVRAISRTMHYVLKVLQSGGLDFIAPDNDRDVEITVSQAFKGGLTYVKPVIKTI